MDTIKKGIAIIFFIALVFNGFGKSLNKTVIVIKFENKLDTVNLLKNCDNYQFNIFWMNFRNAVLKDDLEFIKSNTQFPLLIRGSLDNEWMMKTDSSEFENVFNSYLSQISGLNPKNLLETELEFIKRTTDITVEHLNKFTPICVEDEIRIGSLKFKKISEVWYLVMIYFEDTPSSSEVK